MCKKSDPPPGVDVPQNKLIIIGAIAINIQFFGFPHNFTGTVEMPWVGNNNWRSWTGAAPSNGWIFTFSILPALIGCSGFVAHYVGGFQRWNAVWTNEPLKSLEPITSGVHSFQQLFTTGAALGSFFESNF